MALHSFYQNEGYLWVHSPILTTNNCEELGDLFQVEPESYFQGTSSVDEHTNSRVSFFGLPTYLTVSGQLHAEMLACGMTSVYTFGPTFRAEKSQTRRHLAEFWMFEAESCNYEIMEDLTQVLEKCIKWTLKHLMDNYEEDIYYFHKTFSSQSQADVAIALRKEFVRMTYTEAVKMLKQNDSEFQFKPEWGGDLQSEHERHLVKYCGNAPVFVTDFPRSLKPVYARDNGDSTAATVDLLVPTVGEVAGGSLREERFSILKDRMKRKGFGDQYDWYLDLARFGAMPHGGFGLGFDRYVQYILGLENIRDVIPFPRFVGSCRY
ncbi:probable asparagine--tRNA ligase, mitochondrial isoform X2 [Corticium candelabrum]|nr:probable asparagine--tRNA ligase, mitochondrial isoform X2 [Corticium candelabrum]